MKNLVQQVSFSSSILSKTWFFGAFAFDPPRHNSIHLAATHPTQHRVYCLHPATKVHFQAWATTAKAKTLAYSPWAIPAHSPQLQVCQILPDFSCFNLSQIIPLLKFPHKILAARALPRQCYFDFLGSKELMFERFRCQALRQLLWHFSLQQFFVLFHFYHLEGHNRLLYHNFHSQVHFGEVTLSCQTFQLDHLAQFHIIFIPWYQCRWSSMNLSHLIFSPLKFSLQLQPTPQWLYLY